MSKSKQIFKYLYRYALEKGSYRVIEAVVPYGKIGVVLWEIGHDIYEILNAATDEDRSELLEEAQGLSEQEVERLSDELSQDTSIINAMDMSEPERKQVARKIYQTLRDLPNQKVNPQQLIQGINQSLFRGNPVLSIQEMQSGSQGLGSAVVQTLMNGKEISQRQVSEYSKEYPTIKGFEIKGLLGQGSYAKVYLAKEGIGDGKERICALKVGVLESQERFEREVKNMKLIQHPNVLSCWNTGVFHDRGISQYWISMPNMGGITLESLILGGKLDLESKLLILIQILEGLTALHEKGIVHRDLKPSNCLISNDFELKISDFGLSKDMNNDIDSSRSRNADAIGTPAYMSPEQINGQNIGFATDIWSFGIIAYELLSGDLPWGREIKPFVLIGKIQYVDIEMKKLAQANVPKVLLQVIYHCLKREVINRYTDANQLSLVLLPILREERNRIRHNRFKSSWHVLLERNLIESFLISSAQKGEIEFKLEQFLSQPALQALSLALDTEKLGAILRELSHIALKLGLNQLIKERSSERKKQQALHQLDLKKKQVILEINWEFERIFSMMSPSQMNEQINVLSEKKSIRLKEVDAQFKTQEAELLKQIQECEIRFQNGLKSLKSELSILISDELKDFDQIKAAEREKADRDRQIRETRERDRLIQEEEALWAKKRRMQYLTIIILPSLLMLGFFLYVWHSNRLIKNKLQEQQKAEEETVKLICQNQDERCDIYLKTGIQFVKIPGASFMMGNQDANSDEQPLHMVNIKDFYISKTEVTVGQYRTCVNAGVCSRLLSCTWGNSNWTNYPSNKENYPINCVDWQQARAFAKWVGGDLPSEAQWEYAARGGGKVLKYPWGNQEASCQYAVMSDEENGCGEGGSWEVCRKVKGNTAQGLCDMGGNVGEWVLDEYQNSYQGAGNNDKGRCTDIDCMSNINAFRVYRGGSWYVNASYLRTTARHYVLPSYQSNHLGFRISKSIN